ncbi:hypothetical protein NL676_028069 [Syzygium grande]|nr:hypothetical protein NL676_028069 [Syzygium grande]
MMMPTFYSFKRLQTAMTFVANLRWIERAFQSSRPAEFLAISGDSANPYLITTTMTFSELRLSHVSVLVKGWFWIPDNLDNLYPCQRGLSCLWTKSPVLADKLDALLFQTSTPPLLLVGKIPDDLGSLPKLQALENGLQGEIPETLSKLRGLGSVQLAFNQLTGEIPPAIFNISGIFSFSAGDNQLRGSIPPYIGDTLPYLIYLNFGSNLFTGVIPPSLSNASGLQKIYFQTNSFHGRLPANLGRLKALERMLVGFNQLRDDFSFITSLTNCSRLEIIGVDFNFLEGPLPDSIGNLSNSVRVISMSSNTMFGTIPPGIGNLFNLSFLGIANNSLSGRVPSSIGALHNLHTLLLSANMLTGEIPSSIGNLTLLNRLHLRFNDFYGEIPQSLGPIPSSISKCLLLERLSLAINSFHGEIPLALGTLRGFLRELDVSHNDFSGKIPRFLVQLTDLNYLNQSLNKLEGEVPKQGVFLNASACLALRIVISVEISFAATIEAMDIDNRSSSVAVRGSIGYVPPEYGMGNMVSTQGDVYSYSILLLEMFTRRRPTEEAFKDHLNLHTFVKVALPHRATEIVDSAIFNGEDERDSERMRDCIVSVLMVGVDCSLESPRDRMGMAEVLKELHKIRARYGAK